MPVAQRRIGEFNESSYFDNTGGLNNATSPFQLQDGEAAGGQNFEYALTGALRKRRGHVKMNTTADTHLITRGIGVWNTPQDVKALLRVSDRKLEKYDLADTFTSLTEDTSTAGSDVFPASTSTPTVFTQFNSSSASLLNFAGNTPGLYAAYSATKYTKNGSETPLGSFSATALTTGGSFITTGNFFYSVSAHKASTGAESNATLDLSVTVTNTLGSVVLTFSSLASFDHTKYNQIFLYRSAVGGVDGFTSGSLVAELTASVVSYVDTGTSILDSQLVPRDASTVLDNGTLPSGTYNIVKTWKRRLVTVQGSELLISDLNKPESWPSVNTITIPSGGSILALGIISFNTDFGNDEYLIAFKEAETWIIKGDDVDNWTLAFVDRTGCVAQNLVVEANGYLYWVDYRGIYLWDGAGKPVYLSRPVEALFQDEGDIDKSLLPYSCGKFFRKNSNISWFLPSKTYGQQKVALKLDLRLTLPGVKSNLGERVLDGVFVPEVSSLAIYAAETYVSTGNEMLILGDDTGFVYNGYTAYNDGGAAIDIEYMTKFLDMGDPNVTKRFDRVIVWVEELGGWDLTLDYWAGYRTQIADKSTRIQPITTTPQSGSALWDVAYWDVAAWDQYEPRITGVVFNLDNNNSNMEGDCLRLRIRQSGIDEPVTVYGYSVYWNETAGHR